MIAPPSAHMPVDDVTGTVAARAGAEEREPPDDVYTYRPDGRAAVGAGDATVRRRDEHARVVERHTRKRRRLPPDRAQHEAARVLCASGVRS